MQQLEAKFAYEKETKGAVRYQEQGHAPVVGTLYIRKHAYHSADWPMELTVLITFDSNKK
jgi:hypothetical protein